MRQIATREKTNAEFLTEFIAEYEAKALDHIDDDDRDRWIAHPTAHQEPALAALLAGKTITEAAAASGVTRQTVHRWLIRDYDFIAVLNRSRRELRDALRDRLHGLAGKAVECVAAAVDAGDAKTAVAVLRGLGLLDGAALAVGPEDPRDLDAADAAAEQYRNIVALRVGR